MALQNPQVETYYPVNTYANLANVPVMRTKAAGGPVAVRVFSRSAVTGADADYITVNLHKLSNTTHSYAAINIAVNTNITANTWQALTNNTTYTTWAADETLALTVVFGVVGNQNFGQTAGTVMYQIDYLDASYPRAFK